MDMPTGQAELRILLLEDEPTDAELAENALREAGLSFVSRRVDTRDSFMQALEEFKPEIILADYKLPAFDGASAVKIVRKQHPETPVIMVTGAMGDEKAIELLKLGARDYILKDRLARLGPAVQRALSAEQGIRARKTAEIALRESEARFRAVFEYAKDVILAFSTDGTLIMLNPAFEQITGWTCDEWLSKSFFPLVHPDDLPNAMHLLQCAVQGEALPVFELRILKKSRDHVVGEFTITPLVHDGTNAYLLGIARDITERKQMEDTIKETSERNQAIMETANDAIICMKPDGTIHLWNHKAEEMFGYTAAEAIGQKMHQLITPEQYREKEIEGLRQFATAGSGPIVGKMQELTALRKGGIEFPVELSISSMNIRGEWHATGIVRDITERKQAEARIRKLTRLYATLSQTNQTIVRTANREELFSGICRSAVDHGRFAMAWVGLVDESMRVVKPVCHFGNEAGYLNDIVVSTNDVPSGCGPTSDSIRGNCVSYVNDYDTDERALPWREAALRRGFRGAAGVPLRFGSKVIGALTLYADELNYFDAEQVSLLEEMAIDIGHALDNFAREAERKQAEIRLTEQLNELRRWHEATLGREMRILELKHEVNELLAHSGKPLRYSSVEAADRGNAIV